MDRNIVKLKITGIALKQPKCTTQLLQVNNHTKSKIKDKNKSLCLGLTALFLSLVLTSHTLNFHTNCL